MPENRRAGLPRLRRLALAGLIVLGASSVSACSETVTHKQSGGQCIEHKTDRLVGIPLLQQEYVCDQ